MAPLHEKKSFIRIQNFQGKLTFNVAFTKVEGVFLVNFQADNFCAFSSYLATN